MPVLWAYARDLFQTPGFGDTIDFVQIKQHYYIVHTDINPTGIVPRGPDLGGWATRTAARSWAAARSATAPRRPAATDRARTGSRRGPGRLSRLPHRASSRHRRRRAGPGRRRRAAGGLVRDRYLAPTIDADQHRPAAQPRHGRR